MGLYVHNENPNFLVKQLRKLYNPLGFSKGYNALLWFIFDGALFGFLLARAQYLNVDGIFKHEAAPGEWFYYKEGHDKIGITLHLVGVIFGGFIAVFQFVPWIRHHAIIAHRIGGYLAITLLLIGDSGALMIARRSFGGGIDTQTWIGLMVIATTVGLGLAYYNIKRLQIDQHRAWMLRVWVWCGSIITTRIINIAAVHCLTTIGSYYYAMPCNKIKYGPGNNKGPWNAYVECRQSLDNNAAVHVDFNGRYEEVAASFDIGFGMSLWLALAIHAVGVEIYLKLTPAESERLRQVSYERQLERGFSHPGSAGLTVDRLGDCEPWRPMEQRAELMPVSDHESTSGDDVARKPSA